MGKNIRDLLENWPKNFIRDSDFVTLLGNKTDDARYAIIKRAFKAGLLKRLRQGLYLIKSKTKQCLPDEFELAMIMYEPSIISLESALSYHCWIPEAVYVTTCTTPKRAQEFTNYLGDFCYKHVPEEGFYVGVKRIESPTGSFLIADPWRALADFMYNRRKSWPNCEHLELDLRIDVEKQLEGDRKLLEVLIENYASRHVRLGLKKIYKSLF